jgi:DNA polymerase-3 subunit gamma/tau
LRQRWPDILEAVKGERRVAWMLLSAASVDSLEGAVLTVAFAGEGQARGFTASGHDQVLTGVLASMLGLNVRVRAAVGTGSGAPGARPASGSPAPGAAAQGAGARGRGSAPGGTVNRPDGSAAGPGAPDAVSGGAGTPPRGFQASPGGPGGTSGGGAAAPAAAAAPPPEPRAGGRTSGRGDPAATADLAEEWPDDAGPAGAPGPTGMELIERQLGGTIIEEIDEP